MANGAGFERVDGRAASVDDLVRLIERDGGVVVTNYISQELAAQIKADLKPYFDTDRTDPSGFFPETTQRAIGLFGKSDACVELALNPLYNAVADKMIGSDYTFWENKEKRTLHTKPVISSTVAFRVNPGGRQQRLHRDDSDYHGQPKDWPLMLGSVTALVKTHAKNGATVAIPGSHLWDFDRCPLDEEAVPAELDVGDTFIFVGNLYHAGGANTCVPTDS